MPMTFSTANSTTLRWARLAPVPRPKRNWIHSAPVRTFERRSQALEEHHQEDLVEHRPHEGQPDALQSVDEEPEDHHHRAADVEHSRGVGNAEHVPGERLAAEEVGVEILAAAAARPRVRSGSWRRSRRAGWKCRGVEGAPARPFWGIRTMRLPNGCSISPASGRGSRRPNATLYVLQTYPRAEPGLQRRR